MSKPVGDYPRTQAEFETWFSTEEACRAYLVQLRWPDGFGCPKCGGAKAWPVRRLLLQCAACGRQTSVTAGSRPSRSVRRPTGLWSSELGEGLAAGVPGAEIGTTRYRGHNPVT